MKARRLLSTANEKLGSVLLVKKSQRFDRLAGVSRVVSEAIEKAECHGTLTRELSDLQMQNWAHMNKIKEEHNEMVDQLAIALRNAGFETELVCEAEIKDSHCMDKDLCISFGGNNTFLKTAMHIKDANKTVIYGVKSIPRQQEDASGMCEAVVDYGHHEQQIPEFIYKLSNAYRMKHL